MRKREWEKGANRNDSLKQLINFESRKKQQQQLGEENLNISIEIIIISFFNLSLSLIDTLARIICIEFVCVGSLLDLSNFFQFLNTYKSFISSPSRLLLNIISFFFLS
ncbi:cation-transporting ATPase 13A3 [Sarcoptes scabiei]|nr:cation-transporting ATPase 13A3 [Sarcoptes scabiei]